MDGSLAGRLAGFGMQLLEGVDPNPDNFVCAGILHGRGAQVGSLLRLEPNKQAQVSQQPPAFCTAAAPRSAPCCGWSPTNRPR